MHKIETVEPLKLVPFNATWIDHAKIDIHAIYRRPRFVRDEFDEIHREYDANGSPTWDLTGGLPVKQHNKWIGKGYEYVTLADLESLIIAARFGTIEGDWSRYNQHQTGGPWNYKKYLAGQQRVSSAALDQLRADVNKYGSDIVESIRKGGDPDFVLPEELRGKRAGYLDEAAEKPAEKKLKVGA